MNKRAKIAFLIVAALAWSCQRFDEMDAEPTTSGNVEVLEDGRLRVKVDLSVVGMGSASVSSRAVTSANGNSWDTTEEYISDVWCMVFGEDDTNYGKSDYSDASPLLQCVNVTSNTNGEVFIVLEEYAGTAFVRFVANLTDREHEAMEIVEKNAWFNIKGSLTASGDVGDIEIGDRPTDKQVELNSLPTFGDYVYQSVGLDGIYTFSTTDPYTTEYATDSDGNQETEEDDNGLESYKYTSINATRPDPTSLSNKFPMSSVGFVMSEISAETMAADIGKVYLIRTCSKMDVTVSDSDFTLYEVYMINCAQEARIRSTVLDVSGSTGEETSSSFDIPVDLGGTINYEPLVETTTVNGTTSPIYFYPNSGGDYVSNTGAVNQDINPQYVIIKGRSKNYDTDGYYKVALKAQYPLSAESTDSNKNDTDYWSALTYDILRNTHFNVVLTTVDKPGYKTLADAMDDDNPASNISYSIIISSSDSRNEILVSNGTYFVELDASRIYAKGYDTSSPITSSVSFTLQPNTADTDYEHPAAYVQADYGVSITGCSVKGGNTLYEIDLSDTDVQSGLFTDGSDYYDAEIAAAYDDFDAFYDDIYNGDDDVHDVWYKVPSSSSTSEVTVAFEAGLSGRIRLRIGDMLKFIPVCVDNTSVTSIGGTLAFSNEKSTSFAYYAIEAIDGCTEDVGTILDSYGEVAANGEANDTDTEPRELRAKIFTDDGTAALYFSQNGYNTDEKVADNTINSETLGLESDATLTTDEHGADLVEAVVDAITNDYTTVYIEQTYEATVISSTGLSTSSDNVFNDIADEITALIEADELPEDFTFSLDLSGMEREDYDTQTVYNTIFKHMAEGLFSGNTYISSLILPSSTYEIHANSFSGCTNLMSVTIGSETDPAYDYDAVTNTNAGKRTVGCEEFILSQNAFAGMASGCVITIYTTSTLVNNDTKSSYTTTTNGYNTGKTYSVPIVQVDDEAPVWTEMPIYLYVFEIN